MILLMINQIRFQLEVNHKHLINLNLMSIIKKKIKLSNILSGYLEADKLRKLI